MLYLGAKPSNMVIVAPRAFWYHNWYHILPLSGKRLTCSMDVFVETKMSTSIIMETLQVRLAIDILANSFDPRPNGVPGFLLGAVSCEEDCDCR